MVWLAVIQKMETAGANHTHAHNVAPNVMKDSLIWKRETILGAADVGVALVVL